MRAGVLALGLILSGGMAFASVGANPDEEIDLINLAIEASNNHDCGRAIGLLKEATEAPVFSAIPEKTQYLAQRVMALCTLLTGDYPAAARFSKLATASQFATPNDWHIRIFAALDSRDSDDASLALMTYVETWPAEATKLRLRIVDRVLHDSQGKAEGDARNRRTLNALYAANWQPEIDPGDWHDGIERDEIWLMLAQYDLAAGNAERARKLALAIANADTVISIRADKRFDGIVAAAPEHFDLAKVFRTAVKRNKAWAESHPDYLEPVVTLSRLLHQLDRQDEALALIDATLAKVKQGTKFKDADEQLNWLHNRRSNVLFGLGRVDEALAAMEAGAFSRENGTANVSQTINLAGAYCLYGRPQDGLKMLAKLDASKASPYGKMGAEETRVCSLAQIPGSPGLDTSLAFIRAHAEDGPTVAIDALLEVGDEQGAAALALRFLADPAKRDAILSRLHTGIDEAHAVPKTPFAKQQDARWKTLAARADVIAAVEAFGHILKLPIVR